MSNADDLKAINDYVMKRSAPAAGAPEAVVKKWQALVNQWQGWYPKTISSWYVSDADLANGKAIRNALMTNQNPDAWHYVQETAADKAGRKAYAERADAPKPSKKPWEAEGLTHSGKYKNKKDVKALQRKINDAGYSPMLKEDGDYGPKTQKGEKWLNLKERAEKDAQKIVAPPPPKPSSPYRMPQKAPPSPPLAKKEEPPAPYVPRFFGIPLDKIAAVGAGLGAVAGVAAGGAVGALIGVPLGFAASALAPEDWR